jgi:glucokinase
MMDLRGAVIRTNEQATPSSLDPAELAAWTLGVGSNLAGAEWKHTRHIGIGVPGAVGKNGQITNAPNLHQIEHPQFIRTLQHEQARHIHIDNDANYALIAELLLGAAYDASSAAMITIGTGLGVGLATDGKILRGRRGIVGEYGYLPVGPLGTRLENLLTGPHLLQYAHDSGIMISSPAEIFTPTADRKLQALRTQFDQALTIVLTAVIVSNEPSLVILGGGIARSLGPHLSDYEQAIEDNLQFHTPLVLASLGDFSGAHGAALTALQHSYIDIGVDPSLASMLPGTRPATGEENRQTRTSK